MEFLVLGPLEVLQGSDPVPLGSAKQRLLLAALLAEANHVVSVDRLAEILWGDDQPADATATVQTYVSRLRRALELAGGAATREGVLVTRPPGYLLHAESEQVDAARFEGLLSDGQARLAAGEATEAATILAQALALWRGGAYAEFADDEFARTEATRLDELRRVAIDFRIEARLRLGAHAELVGELEGIVASDPLRERPQAQLMLALYRCGREAEALRSYQQYRRYLRDELGVDPSTGLQRLEEEILHQSPDLDWVRPVVPAIDRDKPSGVDRSSARGPTPTPAVERLDADAGRRGDDRVAEGSEAVTFFFSDLEGSTRLWEQYPEAMHAALARHDTILREAVTAHRGQVVKTTGDGVVAVFGDARDAVFAAVAAQRSLNAEPWPDTGLLQVRIGLHSGTAEHRDADYFGVQVNRAARLMAVANGGQVLASGTTQELAADTAGNGIGFLDLGEHWLQDVTRPERIFQVLAPGLPSEFPACRWSEGVITNLPRPVTSFVGREHELEAVTAAMGEARLVTITGVGGVGKTRLALEVAGGVAPTYPDGVALCELSATTSAEEVPQIVVAALRGRVQPGLTLEDSIAEFLASKRLLLMLDNCEHLLEAAAHLAHTILRRCPKVRILATSRESLGVEGEQVWLLRSLALPDSPNTEAVASSAAARLFEDRARAARPGFTIEASNADAVAALCRHLDGNPLAIELAAARVTAMSPNEILDHLDERFQLLAGRWRAADERHQTMRRTVEWSYSLLEPTERLVFDRLSVFTGTFDATAAGTVVADEGLGDWDVLDALSNLVAKSMLTADSDGGSMTRFQLLETLRHYARERLEETGEVSRWRRRHAEFYAGFAERAGRGLEGADELAWRRQIRAELGNLRAAVGWALDPGQGGDTQLAVRIVASLAYQVASDLSAGVGGWAERAVPQVEGVPPGQRAAVLAAAGWHAYGHGDLETAKRLALAVVDRGPGDSPVPMLPYACASLVDVQGGRADEALQRMLEAKQIVDAVGAPLRERADVRAFAAFCAVTAGSHEQASALIDEAIQLASDSGSPSAQAHALAILGHVLQDEDVGAALIALRESVALTHAGASDFALTAALHKAAQLMARGGEAGPALAELRDAVVHDHQRGSRPSLLYTLNIGVEVLAELGHAELAAVLVGIVTAGPLAPLVADRIQAREMTRLEPILGRLRADLGPDRYDAAVARGAGLSYDELVAYTLSELERIAESGPAG